MNEQIEMSFHVNFKTFSFVPVHTIINNIMCMVFRHVYHCKTTKVYDFTLHIVYVLKNWEYLYKI